MKSYDAYGVTKCVHICVLVYVCREFENYGFRYYILIVYISGTQMFQSQRFIMTYQIIEHLKCNDFIWQHAHLNMPQSNWLLIKSA